MSHTKGPWETHWNWDKAGYPCFYIHGFAGDEKRDEDAMGANARLIAAAPEMLAKLQELKDWADNRADINWNDQPNDAMEVQSIIGDILSRVGVK